MESLKKFYDAQESMYDRAFDEIRNGRKQSHWMWYVFPQIVGLGESDISFYFSIKSLEEAKAYLNDKVLGKRLIDITSELLKKDVDDINDIFGEIDSKKLLSSMTLFSFVSSSDVFQQVIDKYYDGKRDEKTVEFCKIYKK